MAGPVSVSAPSASTPSSSKVLPFKQPFKAVAQLSTKTATITKPIDPAISKTLDFVYSGYSVRSGWVGGWIDERTNIPFSSDPIDLWSTTHHVLSTFTPSNHCHLSSSSHPPTHSPNHPFMQTVQSKVAKAPKVNPYLLIAGGLLLSGLVSCCLLIPALLFFPVTIVLGVATSFGKWVVE